MQQQEYKLDICVGIVSVIIGIAAFVLALDMPGRAKLFPELVGILFCILGGSLSLNSLVKLRKGKESSKETITLEQLKSPLCVFTLLIVYVFMMLNIGFYVTTPLMLILYMRIMGIRSWKTIIITDIIFMLFVFCLFTLALDIPLPAGLLR